MSGLKLLATTGVTGFALQNATPTILSWTAPNDGNLHRFVILSAISVIVSETGGTCIVACTNPDGTSASHTLTGGGSSVGDVQQGNFFNRVIKAGTTVTVSQSSALTLGQATIWAEIWGS